MKETSCAMVKKSADLKKAIAKILFKYSQGYSPAGVRSAFNDEVRMSIESLVCGKLCPNDIRIRVTHHSLKGYKLFIHSDIDEINEILVVSGFDDGIPFDEILKDQSKG